MTSAHATPVCNVIRYKRPPRKRAGEKSGFALRLEGSLAAVVTLAPVIPMFPVLEFPTSDSLATSVGPAALKH